MQGIKSSQTQLSEGCTKLYNNNTEIKRGPPNPIPKHKLYPNL